MKLTLEEKLVNVKLHVDDGVPLYEIQKTRGQNIDPWNTTLLCIVHMAKKHFKKNKKEYSILANIEDHLVNGRSFRQIAIDLMLTEPGIVSDWVTWVQNETVLLRLFLHKLEEPDWYNASSIFYGLEFRRLFVFIRIRF